MTPTPTKRQRVLSYLDRCQGAVSGRGGHDHTFRVTCAIVKGFACDADEAYSYLSDWNSKCQPPWSEPELRHKINSALDAPDLLGNPGYLLEKEAAGEFTKDREKSPTNLPPSVTIDPDDMKRRKIARAGSEKFQTLQPWTIDEMIAASPLALPKTPDEMFEAFITTMWDPQDILWVGAVSDSGDPSKLGYFARPEVWYRRGLPGSGRCFSSGCTYKAGTYSRCKEDVVLHRYAVVESDKHSYDVQGGVLKYLIDLGLPIRMIVDTRGASLHGWLDVTGFSKGYIDRLQLLLCGIHDGLEPNPNWKPENGPEGKLRRKFYGGMGCDPATFRGSQPARLPGAHREPQPGKIGGTQRIIYLA